MTVREVIDAARASTASPACRWSKGGKVVGIVTNRDLRFETNLDQPVQRDHDAARAAGHGARGREPRGGEGAACTSTGSSACWWSTTTFELRGLITVKDIPKATEHPERLQGRARAAARRRGGRRRRGHRGARRGAGRGRRRRDRRRHRARPLAGRARPRAAGSRRNYPQVAGDRRQHRHRPTARRRWSTPAPTASRSASARARSAPRASSPASACRRSRAIQNVAEALAKTRRAAASPTAASATRATSPRRSPPARTR